MKIVSNSALLSNENKERTFDLFKAGPSIWSEAVFSKNSLKIGIVLLAISSLECYAQIRTFIVTRLI